MSDESAPPRKYVTNNELALELRALRSDVKVWILAAVALNQFLAAVDLPSSVAGAAILGLGVKAVGSFLFTRFGG